MSDYPRIWPPEAEHEFQTFMAFDPAVRQWRSSFERQYGEQPRIDSGDYNYRQAYLAGAKPQAVPGDVVSHWPSVGKSANHPTAWKQHFMDQFGMDPDEIGRSGQATPEQQQVLQNQVRRSLIDDFLFQPR